MLKLYVFLIALLRVDPFATEIKAFTAISFRKVVSDCFPDIQRKYFGVLPVGSLCAVNILQVNISGVSEMEWQNYILIAMSITLNYATWI